MFPKVVARKTQLLLDVQLLLAAQTQLRLETWRFLTLSAQLLLETHYIHCIYVMPLIWLFLVSESKAPLGGHI